MNPVTIGNRRIAQGAPCYVIAEAGVNHNGDVDLGRRMIDAAAAAGADAVKFQTFSADRLAASDAAKADYQMRTTSSSESQYEMLKSLELTTQAHEALMRHCASRNIMFLSSPFDEDAADLLDAMNVAAFKIPSGEIVNLPFLQYVAAKCRPMILSSGMATLEEVEAAVTAIRAQRNDDIVVLHCVSDYPARPAEVNLRAMATIRTACGVTVGFSDHTEGDAVALAAVALGACLIEKHFTLDRNLPGPDHLASSEPDELAALVEGIRSVEAALGDGCKEPQPSEMQNRLLMRKSLMAKRDLPAGSTVRQDDLMALRPGTGISPARAPEIIGRRLSVSVRAGSQISWDMLA